MRLPVIGTIGNTYDRQTLVRLGAKNSQEFRDRLDYLISILRKKGYEVTCNYNPDGLCCMPGTCFNGSILDFVPSPNSHVSWDEWVVFSEDPSDGLPPVVPLSILLANPPTQPEPLIEGILRRGHKMIISGPSKSGKSFLLMALCIAIAEGIPWLGFACRPGRVLYVNLEIDDASCIDRFKQIYNALGIEQKQTDNIVIWNLRGHAAPLDKLAPKIISRAKAKGVNAIILDPFYKLNNGDENNAGDMARFVNNLDMICTETDAAVIYSHHHSKSSADRKAINRASGSTVFARDPDAILDLIDLERPQVVKTNVSKSATALRMSFVLREFSSPNPINLWFDYPLHRLDVLGELADAPIAGDYQVQQKRGNSNNGGGSNRVDPYDAFVQAFDALATDPPVTTKAIANRLGVTERTIRNRMKSYTDYINIGGIVTRNTE